MFKNALFATIVALVLGLCPLSAAQNSAKPLTNEDVVAMVKGGLGESTILSAIQSQDSSFDVSANALLALKKNAVSGHIMDAMLAANKQQAQSKPAPAPAAAPGAPTAAAAPVANSGQPSVTLVQGANKAADSKCSHANRTDQNEGPQSERSSYGRSTGSGNDVNGGSGRLYGGYEKRFNDGSVHDGTGFHGNGRFLGHRRPTNTHVWALPGQKSETVLRTAQPAFEVHYESIPGVNADEYEPVLLKLEPTNSNFRLVGATQAKQDVLEASAADWRMYSSFIEQRIASQLKKLAAGNYEMQPSSALAPGEYAIALRPINKDKKFSGSSISQNTGDGLMFNSAWAFEVQQ